MEIDKRVSYFVGPCKHLLKRVRFPDGQCVQVYPLDVVHHQVLSFRKDEVICNAGQVRMAEGGQQGGFTTELTLRLWAWV